MGNENSTLDEDLWDKGSYTRPANRRRIPEPGRQQTGDPLGQGGGGSALGGRRAVGGLEGRPTSVESKGNSKDDKVGSKDQSESPGNGLDTSTPQPAKLSPEQQSRPQRLDKADQGDVAALSAVSDEKQGKHPDKQQEKQPDPLPEPDRHVDDKIALASKLDTPQKSGSENPQIGQAGTRTENVSSSSTNPSGDTRDVQSSTTTRQAGEASSDQLVIDLAALKHSKSSISTPNTTPESQGTSTPPSSTPAKKPLLTKKSKQILQPPLALNPQEAGFSYAKIVLDHKSSTTGNSEKPAGESSTTAPPDPETVNSLDTLKAPAKRLDWTDEGPGSPPDNQLSVKGKERAHSEKAEANRALDREPDSSAQTQPPGKQATQNEQSASLEWRSKAGLSHPNYKDPASINPAPFAGSQKSSTDWKTAHGEPSSKPQNWPSTKPSQDVPASSKPKIWIDHSNSSRSYTRSIKQDPETKLRFEQLKLIQYLRMRYDELPSTKQKFGPSPQPWQLIANALEEFENPPPHVQPDPLEKSIPAKNKASEYWQRATQTEAETGEYEEREFQTVVETKDTATGSDLPLELIQPEGHDPNVRERILMNQLAEVRRIADNQALDDACEIERLNEIIKDYEKALEEAREGKQAVAEAMEAKRDKQFMQEFVVEMQVQLTDARAKIEEQESALSSAHAEIQQLRDWATYVEDERRDAQNEILGLQGQVEQLQVQLEEQVSDGSDVGVERRQTGLQQQRAEDSAEMESLQQELANVRHQMEQQRIQNAEEIQRLQGKLEKAIAKNIDPNPKLDVEDEIQISVVKERILDVEKQISAIVAEKDAEIEMVRSKLNSDMELMRQEFDEATENITKKAEEEIDSLTTQLNEARALNQSVLSKINDDVQYWRSEAERLAEEYEASQHEIGLMSNDINVLEAARDATEKAVKENTAKIAELEEANEAYAESLKKGRNRLDLERMEHNREVTELKRNIAARDEAIEGLMAQMGKLTESLEEKTRSLQSTKDLCAIHMQQVDRLEADVKWWKMKLALSQNGSAELQKKVDELNIQLAQLKAQHEDAARHSGTTIQDLHLANQDLQKKLQEKERLIFNQAHTGATTEAEMKKLRTELHRARSKISNLESSSSAAAASTSKQNNATLDELETCKIELSALKKKLAAMEKEKSQFEANLRTASSASKTEGDQLKKSQAEIKTLKATIEGKDLIITSLNRQVGDLEKKVKEELKKAAERSKDELAKLKAKMDEELRELAESAEEILNVERQLAADTVRALNETSEQEIRTEKNRADQAIKDLEEERAKSTAVLKATMTKAEEHLSAVKEKAAEDLRAAEAKAAEQLQAATSQPVIAARITELVKQAVRTTAIETDLDDLKSDGNPDVVISKVRARKENTKCMILKLAMELETLSGVMAEAKAMKKKALVEEKKILEDKKTKVEEEKTKLEEEMELKSGGSKKKLKRFSAMKKEATTWDMSDPRFWESQGRK